MVKEYLRHFKSRKTYGKGNDNEKTSCSLSENTSIVLSFFHLYTGFSFQFFSKLTTVKLKLLYKINSSSYLLLILSRPNLPLSSGGKH